MMSEMRASGVKPDAISFNTALEMMAAAAQAAARPAPALAPVLVGTAALRGTAGGAFVKSLREGRLLSHCGRGVC